MSQMNREHSIQSGDENRVMTKRKDWKNIIPVIIVMGVLLALTIERIHYVLSATANVPIMDYWRYIVQFVEKVMGEGVSIIDFWKPQAGAAHRSGGISTYLFLLNVKYFGLNTQIEIVLGAIGAFVNCCFLFWIFVKKMKWEIPWAKCAFILVALSIFNINQWEIITLEFSFGFSLRILLVLWCLYFFDSMQQKDRKKVTIFVFAVVMFLVSMVTGSYAPAILGAFIFITLVQLCVEKEKKKQVFIQNIVVTAFTLLGIILFFWDLGGGTGDGATNTFLDMVLDGTLVKGVFLMLGSSILHVESTAAAQNVNILYLGIALFVLYIVAIILFFRRKMYKQTYMPLMLMAYTACAILVIAYGRIPMFGASYVISSRYVCDTTLGLAGIFWIYIYEIQALINEKLKRRIAGVAKLVVCFAGMIMIIVSLRYSYNTEMTIAPYRKIYQENLIKIMQSNETITEEQARNFQSETELVNQGVELMKKYHLGVFKDLEE